jgi:hypothetical protein
MNNPINQSIFNFYQSKDENNHNKSEKSVFKIPLKCLTMDQKTRGEASAIL